MRINCFIKNYMCSNTCFNGANNPKVSVILPIYNQERYLAAALDSLERQTLDDTEFICVNDGSVDDTPRILKSYAAKDKRIIIINQKNQGSGAARNTGLSAAKGEYIAFLDPDDTLEPSALATIYGKSKKLDCDIAAFNFKRVNEDGSIRWQSNLQEKLNNIFDISKNRVFNWRNIKPEAFEGLFLMAWNKIYKNDFVKNSRLRFADCSLAEDNLFSIGATFNAKSITYLPQHFYNYIRHKNSAVQRCSDKNLCIFDVIEAVKQLLINLGLQYELADEFDKYAVNLLSYHVNQIPSKDKLLLACKNNLSASQYNIAKARKLI